MSSEVLISELSWTRYEAKLRHDNPVIILPVGSLEQHGHHLPMLTDTMIITEVARRAETALGDEALFLPTLWPCRAA